MTMNGRFVVIGSYFNQRDVWGPFDSLREARAAIERHAKENKQKGSWDSTEMTYVADYLTCRIEQRCNIVLLGD